MRQDPREELGITRKAFVQLPEAGITSEKQLSLRGRHTAGCPVTRAALSAYGAVA
jgi:hypothetical protein